MKIARSNRFFGLAVLSALCAAAAARADVIYSNFDTVFGPATAAIRCPTHQFGYYEVATPFTVATTGDYVLTSVEFAVAQGATTSATVKVMPDVAGTPGAPIVTFMLSDINTPTPAVRGASPGSQVTLQAGHTYWVGLSVSSCSVINADIFWQSSLTTGAFASRFSVAGAWSAGTGVLMLTLRVNGTPVPPPIAACCNPATSACAVTTQDVCNALGGNFIAQRAACTVLTCPIVVPSGACCTGTSCTIGPLFACAGRYLGDNSACQPVAGLNPCCPIDFDHSGTVAIGDIFAYLTAWFQRCP